MILMSSTIRRNACAERCRQKTSGMSCCTSRPCMHERRVIGRLPAAPSQHHRPVHVRQAHRSSYSKVRSPHKRSSSSFTDNNCLQYYAAGHQRCPSRLAHPDNLRIRAPTTNDVERKLNAAAAIEMSTAVGMSNVLDGFLVI